MGSKPCQQGSPEAGWLVVRSRPDVTKAGVSQFLFKLFFLFQISNMAMEGSKYSIFPLLILIFLSLPAIIPNFAGKLQWVRKKYVQIWDF